MTTVNNITTAYNWVVPWVWYATKTFTNTWENWNNTWWDHHNREFEKNILKGKVEKSISEKSLEDSYKLTIWHNVQNISTEQYFELKMLLS